MEVLMFKKLIAAATFLSAVVFIGAQVKAADAVVLKLAEIHPKGYPTEMADEYFAELAGKYSKGALKVEVYPGGQLGDEKAMIEQVQLGALAFCRVSSAPMAEFNKDLGVFSLPYIFDNTSHMWKFLNGKDGQALLDGLSKSKFIGLCYYDGGARNFYASKPIKGINDLKGLKIRVQQNKINMEMISAFGASATPMPMGQVFSSLQTGVIDGAENNWPSYESANHYNVAKYYLVDQHLRLPEVLVMSKVIFDKLSKANQDALRKAAKDSVAKQRELWDAREKSSEAIVRKAGSIVTEVKDLKPYQAAVKKLIDGYQKDYGTVLKAIDKARK
jgi:tripartite ATP-independent transporter DctP family solute receptor